MQFSEVIEANKDSLCKVFEVLNPWGEGNPVRNRIIWVSCIGVPLSMWTVDCFKKIVHRVGTVVEVYEATLA